MRFAKRENSDDEARQGVEAVVEDKAFNLREVCGCVGVWVCAKFGHFRFVCSFHNLGGASGDVTSVCVSGREGREVSPTPTTTSISLVTARRKLMVPLLSPIIQ